MSTGRIGNEVNLERLSALADGELDPGDVEAACGDWRADGELRRTWHAWHAIGDVLRSDDLACDAEADRTFCAAVSARLASEAVVLAPTPLASTPARAAWPRSRWAVGSAMAAGVVLVAGTFALVGPGSGPSTTPERVALVDGNAASSAGSDLARAMPTVAAAQAPQLATVADPQVIRDAQLDRYLVAHKQFAGSSALGVPSTFLRSATVDPSSR